MPIGTLLKLKGGEPLKGVKKKKKEKGGRELAVGAPRAEAPEGAREDSPGDELKRVLHGYEVEGKGEGADRRTEAEKKRSEKMAVLEEQRLRKFAEKSHPERVADFNAHLSKLSEHHDIPKVGPG
ncbi:hypothetical protein FOA52_001541 [Chlamydomonas sp. UWO 241]|nr:hypothetical protein FOA52_001541 [Chlamydomonas sp. UWO 241]